MAAPSSRTLSAICALVRSVLISLIGLRLSIRRSNHEGYSVDACAASPEIGRITSRNGQRYARSVGLPVDGAISIRPLHAPDHGERTQGSGMGMTEAVTHPARNGCDVGGHRGEKCW